MGRPPRPIPKSGEIAGNALVFDDRILLANLGSGGELRVLLWCALFFGGFIAVCAKRPATDMHIVAMRAAARADEI